MSDNKITQYVMLPRLDSFKDADEVKQMHPDWKVVTCPSCGTECFMGDTARHLAAGENMQAVCTRCALAKQTGAILSRPESEI